MWMLLGDQTANAVLQIRYRFDLQQLRCLFQKNGKRKK